MATRTVQDTGPERFYHRLGGIRMYFGKDQRVVQDGVATVIDAEPIQFVPCSNHDYGVYTTERADIKSYLLSRGDVLTELEFLEQTLTAEEKLKSMAGRTEKLEREIQEKNQLIADLQMRQRPPAPMKSAS